MRLAALLLCVVTATSLAGWAQSTQPEPAEQLVRAVVYNELQDHDAHGYWQYWVRTHVQDGTRLALQVETPDGPLTRVVAHNGQPLDPQSREAEHHQLEHLLSSASERANHREAYAQDEKRVKRILAMLPDAFQFEEAGTVDGIRHLRFKPRPDYPAHSIEGRFFHALNGELWIDTRAMRMTCLQGHLDDDLSFGFGVLGRINRGSWFRMDRKQVSKSEWKTNRLEVHMNGRALLFKTIAHETSEIRGGFSPLPSNINLVQGVHLLEQANAQELSKAEPQFTPVSFGH